VIVKQAKLWPMAEEQGSGGAEVRGRHGDREQGSRGAEVMQSHKELDVYQMAC
jgi:hypothetical protein